MQYRLLGRTGISVSEIGIGGWAIGGDEWGHQNDRDSTDAIRMALNMGCNFLDTALAYGSGHSERLIGQVLRERKNSCVVATKVPPRNGIWGPASYQSIDVAFPPNWIIDCCERSLQNLGVDCIDILLLHTWSTSWNHRTEWYEAMKLLKETGKIRAIGISVHDEHVSQANVHIEAGRIDVVEVVYNIFQQLPEYELFPLALMHDVGIIARSPLQAGILTGRITLHTEFDAGDWRKEWTDPEWLAVNLRMLDRVRPIINSVGLPMSQVAILFALANSAISVVIPGGRNATQVESNCLSAGLPRLPENIVEAFRCIWRKGEIHGTYLGSS